MSKMCAYSIFPPSKALILWPEARLQTFPDTYVFHGSWTETMRQLGNAVPVALARIMAGSIAEKLIEAEAKQLIAKMQRAA